MLPSIYYDRDDLWLNDCPIPSLHVNYLVITVVQAIYPPVIKHGLAESHPFMIFDNTREQIVTINFQGLPKSHETCWNIPSKSIDSTFREKPKYGIMDLSGHVPDMLEDGQISLRTDHDSKHDGFVSPFQNVFRHEHRGPRDNRACNDVQLGSTCNSALDFRGPKTWNRSFYQMYLPWISIGILGDMLWRGSFHLHFCCSIFTDASPCEKWLDLDRVMGRECGTKVGQHRDQRSGEQKKTSKNLSPTEYTIYIYIDMYIYIYIFLFSYIYIIIYI